MQREVASAETTQQTDYGLMQMALVAARRAAAAGEVPIGAVVVLDGTVLAAAHNAPITLNDPTAHAEILALRAAARGVRNYRIPRAVLYATVEPCAMCVAAAVQARVARVVFGCADVKGGALGSVYDLMGSGRMNHRFTVEGGVCADEARDLLQEFFRARRGA